MSSASQAPSDPTTAAAVLAAPNTKTVHLKATYTSPRTSEPQVLSSTPLALAIPPASASASETLQAKTSYLRALRAATVALQDRINAELTARMEEDARDAAAGGSGAGIAGKTTQGGTAAASAAAASVDEVAEEENYGEEMAEEDDEV
ncbi:hypothetical protein GGR51DRAFT_565116 [Nemania sp. FL0031]|nr:hypothetical protein GGR51DRAFT_565116 [Nemania sp. FL0031]